MNGNCSQTKTSLPSTVPQTHPAGYGKVKAPQRPFFTFLSSLNRWKSVCLHYPHTLRKIATQQLEYRQWKRKQSKKNDIIERNRGSNVIAGHDPPKQITGIIVHSPVTWYWETRMGEDTGKARQDKSTSNNKPILIRDVLTVGRFWLAHCEWAAQHTQGNTILLEKAVSNSSYEFHLSFISCFHLNHKTILSFFLSFFPFYTIMLLDNPRSVLKDSG